MQHKIFVSFWVCAGVEVFYSVGVGGEEVGIMYTSIQVKYHSMSQKISLSIL